MAKQNIFNNETFFEGYKKSNKNKYDSTGGYPIYGVAAR